jgi:hypothetical protein
LFAGSDRGGCGERAAAMHTLIATAKLNDIDPQAWLADVLRRINDQPASRLREFVPWNWGRPSPKPPPPNRDSPVGMPRCRSACGACSRASTRAGDA